MPTMGCWVALLFALLKREACFQLYTAFALILSLASAIICTMKRFLFFAMAGALACAPVLAACPFSYWFTFRGTAVYRTADQSAYLYKTNYIAIDADGAPNAYGPNDTGIDTNVHAGFPGQSWWPYVLVPDPVDPSKPYVQTSGTYKGMYVSKTHLYNTMGAYTDPATYVDALKIPYIVFPTGFMEIKGAGGMGDFGVAIAATADGKRRYRSPAIVADSGGGAEPPLGEVSVYLANALGGKNVNPRNGAGQPKGPFVHVIFPGTKLSPAWPLTKQQIQDRSEGLLKTVGGWAAVEYCKRTLP